MVLLRGWRLALQLLSSHHGSLDLVPLRFVDGNGIFCPLVEQHAVVGQSIFGGFQLSPAGFAEREASSADSHLRLDLVAVVVGGVRNCIPPDGVAAIA